jgi:hypothetical protein
VADLSAKLQSASGALSTAANLKLKGGRATGKEKAQYDGVDQEDTPLSQATKDRCGKG